MKYTAIFPFTHDMGDVASVVVHDKMMESKEEEALWYYNGVRDHDGLRPLQILPPGTRFELVD